MSSEARNNASRRWRAKQKALGLCVICSDPVGPVSKIMCEKCRKRALERRQKKQKEGTCRLCGMKREKSTTYCNDCLEKNKKAYKDKRRDEDYDKKIRFYGIRARAKKHGIVFALSIEEFLNWFNIQTKQCHYCGATEGSLKLTGRVKSMLTVDRKDNRRGYESGNVCLACFRCNNMKSNFFTEAEWKEIAEKYIKPRLEEYHRP